MGDLHFSQAAEKNKNFILRELRKALLPRDHVLEIASGTGQHAIHFSTHMSDIVWQPSDRNLLEYRLAETLAGHSITNLSVAIEVDINHWPKLYTQYDAVYSANCLHVIDWQSVENYIKGAATCLKTHAALILYGPFKYGGDFTTESNEKFDAFLRETYLGGGIRDFQAIDDLAQREGLFFQSDTPMPANNQLLIWSKSSAAK